MQEPKLKLEHLKSNPNIENRVFIPLKNSSALMVDPRDFAFYRRTKAKKATTGFKDNLIVKYEYTPEHRYAVSVEFSIVNYEAIEKDCLRMAEYSKQYQLWLKSKAEPSSATINCGKDLNNGSKHKS